MPSFVLAPVLDLASDSPWLAVRLVGDAADAARVGAVFVRGMERAGVATAPKHFPGHRGLKTDPTLSTDTVVPVDRRQLVADLAPFQAAIEAGARCVMVGPGTLPAVDPNESAVYSPAVLDLLRTECRFSGVLISDDLDAASIARGRGVADVAMAAMGAGNDVLLLSSDADLDGVTARLAAGTDERRLAEAAERVARLGRPTTLRRVAAAGRQAGSAMMPGGQPGARRVHQPRPVLPVRASARSPGSPRWPAYGLRRNWPRGASARRGPGCARARAHPGRCEARRPG